MSYIKASDLLPKELIEVIQNYVDGVYVYIPRKECNRKSWGDNTASRNEIQGRNINIYKEYQQGVCIKLLAKKYYLSEKSVQRIITEMKRNE